jgi:hypothetical protein
MEEVPPTGKQPTQIAKRTRKSQSMNEAEAKAKKE